MKTSQKILSACLIALALVIGGTAWQLWQTANGLTTVRRQTSASTSNQSGSRSKHSGVKKVKSHHSDESKKALINKELKTNHFVGTALIVKNDHVVFQKSYGYSNRASNSLNTNRSPYQILSIQKTFTAVMVRKLVAQHRLSMNTRLSRFYPQIKNANHIRIRNMLNMTSGISLKMNNNKRVLNEAGVVGYAVKHVKVNSRQLGNWRYEAVNFVLLSGIIRNLTHHSYAYNFTHTIQKPLHLTHTGFVQKRNLDPYKTTSYRYNTRNQRVPIYTRVSKERRSSMNNELGTGNVYMTAWDLFKAEHYVLRGKVIPAADVRQLQQPGSSSTYGGGVYNQANGIRLHGIGYGYESAGLLTRNGKSGVILLSNNYRPGASILPISQNLFNALLAGRYGRLSS